MKKRLIALLLVFCMVAAMLPSAFAADTALPFTDVASGAWYYDSVLYTYENGLMSGTSATTFSPDMSLTRGMFVTILGRMDGVDETAYTTTSFSDVSLSTYYSAYVEWAYEQGIVYGVGNDCFAPNVSISREQMATIIYRYLDCKGIVLPESSDEVDYYTDASSIADYAQDPVESMRKTGLFSGDNNGRFNPKQATSRAEAAALFSRLDENIASLNGIVAQLDNNTASYEIFAFTTDTWDILLGETAEVTFTAEIFAESTIDENAVSVIDDAGTVVGYMNDAGTDGDETADDGIYTLRTQLSSDTMGAVHYAAHLADQTSQSVNICFYRVITDEEYSAFDTLSDTLNAMTDVNEVIAYLDSSDDIESFEPSSDYSTVSYRTTAGMSGVWEAVSDTTVKGDGEEAPEYTEYAADDSYDLYKSEDSYDEAAVDDTYDETELDSIVNSTTAGTITDTSLRVDSDVLVLRPFRGTQFDYDDFKTAGTTIANKLGGNIVVKDDAAASLLRFNSFSGYGVILIDSHGTTYTNEAGVTNPYMLTGQDASSYTNSADWQAARVVSAAGRVCVGGDYIDRYYDAGTLDHSVFFLGTCYSLYNDTIANALISKGAEVVYGYEQPVSVGYCNNTLDETMVKQLVNKNSKSSSAYNAAISKYGTTSANYQMRGKNAFVVKNGAVISGKVTRADDGTAISNALIRVYDRNGDEVASARTDSDGNYEIAAPAGNYVVQISAGGYRSVKNAITLFAGETTYTETALMTSLEWSLGYANGYITDALTGVGVAGVTIKLRKSANNENGEVLYTTTTDSNGYYSIDYQPGTFTMEMSREDYVTGYKSVTLVPVVSTQTNATLTPIVDSSEYRILLTWGETPSDLDSHLVGTVSSGSSEHVYYSHKTGETCNLDHDDTSSYGPETITVTNFSNLQNGFTYYVHNYTNRNSSDSSALAHSDAKVEVYKGSILVKTYHVPTGSEGTLWKVFSVSKNGTITTYNTFSYQSNAGNVGSGS